MASLIHVTSTPRRCCGWRMAARRMSFEARLSLWAVSLLVVVALFGMSQMECLWVEMEQRRIMETRAQTRIVRLSSPVSALA